MLTPFSIRAVPLAKLPLLGPEEVRLIEFFVAGSPTAQCIADLRDAMPQDLMHGWLAGKLRASSMLVDSSVLSSMAGKLWVGTSPMLVGTGWDQESRHKVRSLHQAWLNYRSEKGIAHAETFEEQVVQFVQYGLRNELFPGRRNELFPAIAVQVCFSFRDDGRGWHWEYMPTGLLIWNIM